MENVVVVSRCSGSGGSGKGDSGSGSGSSKRRLKVKRRRRGKKRHTATAAKAAFAGVPSKSGDDDSYGSELETCPADDVFPPDKQASLRPVVVPKAPENSTQFLIDDHENSSLFFNFEHSYKSPSWCGPTDHPAHFFPDDADVDAGMDSCGEEDFSSMYYMRDFESEYQNAKEEVLLDWPRETLFSEILRLEERAQSLEQLLILQDPHNYINKLQEQLLHLQEENAKLRASLRSASSTCFSGPPRQDVDSGGGSAASTLNSSSDEDVVCPRRGRRRVDTASDLVMVVAPLSIRDPTAPTHASAPTAAHLHEMEIA